MLSQSASSPYLLHSVLFHNPISSSHARLSSTSFRVDFLLPTLPSSAHPWKTYQPSAPGLTICLSISGSCGCLVLVFFCIEQLSWFPDPLPGPNQPCSILVCSAWTFLFSCAQYLPCSVTAEFQIRLHYELFPVSCVLHLGSDTLHYTCLLWWRPGL